jgi:hypothetical protein
MAGAALHGQERMSGEFLHCNVCFGWKADIAPSIQGCIVAAVKASLPLLLSVTLSACVTGGDSRPWTVRQVVEKAEVLNGTEVVVAGWLETCQRLSCALYDSPAEATKDGPTAYLSVGSSDWFDAEARRNGPAHVIIRARVDSRCISDPRQNVMKLCTDRPGDLHPLEIIRWSPHRS